MTAPVIQFKRGPFTNLPGLRAGEPGFTTDSYELYVGIDSTTNNNKFFGSHRYWTRETTSTGSGINLVEGTSNGSSFITLKSPGSLAGITTYTFPASPIVSNVLTTDADGILSWTAVVNELTIGSLISGIGTFTNNVGFTTTTDNTLGNENTGGVQLDGGMGIAKNLTVKQNLHVGGYAEFVGVVTFKGGTINIGDENTDNINVGGEFISSLTPNVDNTHDLGITTQRWRTLNVVSVATTNINASGIITASSIVVSSGSTFTNGPILVGTSVSTGTASQPLQVTGGAYVSGSVGLGTTNPTSKLHVVGDVRVSGVVTATTFVGALTGTATTTTNIPNLTGAITSVNTTTSLGSFSSANLATALTDETGSGANVFATSPTLVTPVLGDATATTIVTSGVVNVGTALSAPTVKTATIQHSNATNAATIDASGNITAAQNLTISGNLFVNGSTTQVNTAALTVEDRTIDLGIVDGSAPASATTWDLGILFNYYATTAKKSAVIWEHGDARFKFASVLTADSDGSNVNTPQLTVTTFAPIEIGQLWVNDCAGVSQVISCTGTTRNLENITVDCGSF